MNDNPPLFPPSCCHINISEGLDINDVIYTIQATDADEGINSQVSYIIVQGNHEGRLHLPWV